MVMDSNTEIDNEDIFEDRERSEKSEKEPTNVKNEITDSWALTLVENKNFKQIVFATILLNSLFLAIPDYTQVDSSGNLIYRDSFRNTLYYTSDIIFVVFFTSESLVKLIAYGLFGEKGYLRNKWNWLDIAVVFVGWISFIPNAPNLTICRLFRLFRILMLVSNVPSLKKVIFVIVSTFPKLRHVGILAFSVMAFYAILGLQLFSGPYMHTRCRLTPFPVLRNWTEGQDAYTFRCLDVGNVNMPTSPSYVTKQSSPWAVPAVDCFWPEDVEDENFCSLGGGAGHTCFHDSPGIPESAWRWCGSNYDGFGNFRFVPKTVDPEDYIEHLKWGHSNFDNIFKSSLVVFSIMALTGFADVLDNGQDALNNIAVALFMVTLLILGTYVVLSLILSVVNEALKDYKKRGEEEVAEDPAGLERQALDELGMKEEKTDSALSPSNNVVTYVYDLVLCILELRIHTLRPIVQHKYYKWTSFGIVTFNAIVLSVDYYPMPPKAQALLLDINFIVTLLFAAEVAIRLLGLGLKGYFQFAYNWFDFIVMILCFLQAVILPPNDFRTAQSVRRSGDFQDTSAAISVLRALRIFQIVTYATKFQTVNRIWKKLVKILRDVGAFSVLFVIFLYIFTVIGMNLFANRLRFDADGHVITEINSDAWLNAPDRPRYNFDDFILAFATTFQIVTGDNFLVVMDNVWRSRGSWASLFVISVFILGAWVLLFQLVSFIIDSMCEKDEERDQPHEESQEIFVSANEIPARLSPYNLSHSRPGQFTPNNAAVLDDIRSDMCEFDDQLLTNQLQLKVRTQTGSASLITGEIPLGETVAVKMEKSPPKTNSSPQNEVTESFPASKPVPQYDFDVFHPSAPELRTKSDAFDVSVLTSSQATSAGVWWWEWQQRFVNVKKHTLFSLISFWIIIISSICVALESPLLNPDSPLSLALRVIDFITTFSFMILNTIEIIAKSPTVYFVNPWSVMDFVITVISIVGLFVRNPVLNSLRVVKAMRALKSFRMLKSFEGLKAVVEGMMRVVPKVASVLAFLLFVLYIFALFAVVGLRGQFRACQGDVFDMVISASPEYNTALEQPLGPWSEMSMDQKLMFHAENEVFTVFNTSAALASEVCASSWPSLPCCFDSSSHVPYVGSPLVSTSRSYCECWGGEWLPISPLRFDNVGQGVYTLFQMATLDGWTDFMYSGE